MTEPSEKAIILRPGRPAENSEDFSLFEVGETIVRHRWRILGWMLAGGIMAIVPRLSQKFTYTAIASFVPQSTEAGPSGLRGLAGQFGVAFGTSSSAQSPQFYADLLRSPVILLPIAADTFTVSELGGRPQTFLNLMRLTTSSRERNLQDAVASLVNMMEVRVSRETGVLTVAVTTQWPTFSAAIADRLVIGVNAFNLRTRQSQASEERRFTEGRLAEARGALRGAEERLQSLLQRNRQLEYSPQLRLDRDRLQREVDLDQEIVTSLAKAYEEVRIREVRDVAVITVIQRPSVPTQPNPKGRSKRVMLGVLLGALIGVILTFLTRMFERRRMAGDPELEAFIRAVSEVKEDLARLAPWRTRRGITPGPGNLS